MLVLLIAMLGLCLALGALGYGIHTWLKEAQR